MIHVTLLIVFVVAFSGESSKSLEALVSFNYKWSLILCMHVYAYYDHVLYACASNKVW